SRAVSSCYLSDFAVPPSPISTVFPTRRSSDLSSSSDAPDVRRGESGHARYARPCVCLRDTPGHGSSHPLAGGPRRRQVPVHPARSEEHTSELQSRENLVCRLLLEKQKPLLPHT